MELPSKIKRAIRRYETIETEGLTIYPITVAEYDDFNTARPAIDFIQQSLPVRYMNMPLLQAFYAIDYDAFISNQPVTGLFYKCLLFLSLSLRLGQGEDAKDRVKNLVPLVDKHEPSKLIKLSFIQNGELKEITPIMFYRLRPILAAQNGIELVSENANPDLVEAERDIMDAKAPKLDASIEALVSAVAAFSKEDEAEIDDWPILKLQNRQRAYKRQLDYIICGIGETQGTKWKGGNPHPSPYFDRVKEESAALVSLKSFAGGKGLEAIQNAGYTTAQN